jgi:arginase family enzyme
MSEKVVLDFTHTYTKEDFPEEWDMAWEDCSEIIGTNCYCDEDAQTLLRQRLAPYNTAGIHFIDSGNYHYLSKLWTEKIQEPFSLVVFDHHSDMQLPRFEGVLSCGGWIRALLEECQWLEHVYIIGASSSQKAQANGYEDRLFYITEEEANLFFQLEKKFFLTREKKIYLSIDKDVLASTEVHMNWDQGSMTLENLKRQLRMIFQEAEVIGVDICGEDPEQTYAPYIARNKAVNRELCNFLDSYI